MYYANSCFCSYIYAFMIYWKYGTALIIIALAALGAITLPLLTNSTALAQTPSVQPLCTEADIQQHIQQLSEFKTVNFNALVACNSKAVPSLIKTLEYEDENFRIITIAALGEIGTKAAPAVPVLNGLLKDDKRENIRIIVDYALEKIIGKNAVPSLNYLRSGAPSPGALPLHQCRMLVNKKYLIVRCPPKHNVDNAGVRQTATNHLKYNPPVMCNIPIIKAVLTWKCP